MNARPRKLTLEDLEPVSISDFLNKARVAVEVERRVLQFPRQPVPITKYGRQHYAIISIEDLEFLLMHRNERELGTPP